jgi:hypothetical protein
MTQTEDFVGALHLIAASESPMDRQKYAVEEVLARFIRDAQQTLGGNQEPIRIWLEGAKLELDQQAMLPRAGPFADLRDHARALIADWLHDHPRS